MAYVMNKNLKDCDQDFDMKFVYEKHGISWLKYLNSSNY